MSFGFEIELLEHVGQFFDGGRSIVHLCTQRLDKPSELA